MSISFRHLTVLRALMNIGSVPGAVKDLQRTQYAVSATLADLESKLGLELFERRNRRLVPKPEAYFFLKKTNHILGSLNRLERTMQEISRVDRGHLRIGCLPAAANFLMPDLVAEFLIDGIPVARIRTLSCKDVGRPCGDRGRSLSLRAAIMMAEES